MHSLTFTPTLEPIQLLLGRRERLNAVPALRVRGLSPIQTEARYRPTRHAPFSIHAAGYFLRKINKSFESMVYPTDCRASVDTALCDL
jgi:hypothetical protein